MAISVAASMNNVPIMPALLLKTVLPNIPSNINPASGSSGIRAMVNAFGIVGF
jgi:hypothetical protein